MKKISKEDGFVYSWGYNKYGQLGNGDTGQRNIPTLINGLIKIKKFFCGGDHTMAINGNSILSKILILKRK